jgi:thymidylate synthase
LNTPSHKARLLLRSLVRGNNEVLNIYARNVSEALYLGLMHLQDDGVWQETRSGRVLEYPAPVMTIYKRPEERVLFFPSRDANPFFHLFEAFWMLAGRDDLEFVSRFNSRMKEFSDDGYTLSGAYGYRWRQYWLKDQLELLIIHLKNEPNSRRAVLQMWDTKDLEKIVNHSSSKDVPCNTQVYFKIRDDRLQMTVSCRSNDIVWGAYGANAVHFSILQEYIAAKLGLSIGTYYHLSDSFHAYENVYKKTLDILHQKNTGDTLWYDSYLGWNKGMHYSPEPIFTKPDYADIDIYNFLNFSTQVMEEDLSYHNNFFSETAAPMLKAWENYKQQDYDSAILQLEDVPALDWRKAAIEWLERRRQKYQVK